MSCLLFTIGGFCLGYSCQNYSNCSTSQLLTTLSLIACDIAAASPTAAMHAPTWIRACQLLALFPPKQARYNCSSPKVRLTQHPGLLFAELSCLHGQLLLGKCFCDPGFVGARCEQQDTWVPPACNATSDLCFYSRQKVVCQVGHERWKRAQEAEGSRWRAR